jgi:hypothetical protein
VATQLLAFHDLGSQCAFAPKFKMFPVIWISKLCGVCLVSFGLQAKLSAFVLVYDWVVHVVKCYIYARQLYVLEDSICHVLCQLKTYRRSEDVIV